MGTAMGTTTANLAELRRLVGLAEGTCAPVGWLSEAAWSDVHPILESLQLDKMEDEEAVSVLTYLEDLESKYRGSLLGYTLELLGERHRNKYKEKVRLPMAPA